MSSRPVIAPGLSVLARHGGELQIGRSERHRIRLPDNPATRRALAALARGEVPNDREGRRLLATLGPVLRDVDTAADAWAVAARCPDGRFAATVRRHLPLAVAR